jgi:hypothetical protein
MASLRNVRQQEAIMAFCRLGALEQPGRRGRGSHRVLTCNGHILVLPRGVLFVGFLKTLLKRAGIPEADFVKKL